VQPGPARSVYDLSPLTAHLSDALAEDRCESAADVLRAHRAFVPTTRWTLAIAAGGPHRKEDRPAQESRPAGTAMLHFEGWYDAQTLKY
jgi:hypothetical protein